MINLIVAMTNKGYIGKDNQLLFHIKEDMKRFKELTLNHKVIMGRKTFESLPNGALEDRENIVITKDENYKADNITVYNDILELLSYIRSEEEVFVIGGESVYKAVEPVAHKIFLTVIYSDKIGDTKFEYQKENYVMINDFNLHFTKENIPYQFIDLLNKKYIGDSNEKYI